MTSATDTDPQRLARVGIVGTSGSGKTTLARAASRALGVPHIELDALYWGPDWTPRSPEAFRASVEAAAAGPCWVIDGNYSVVRDLVWTRTTTLVWLNYPLAVILPRAVWRTVRRIVTREELFSGNRETFALFDKDWIPWWVLRTYWKRRRNFPDILRRPEFAHVQVLELTRAAQARRFLATCTAWRSDQEAEACPSDSGSTARG